jgi:putative redox protein
MGLATCAAHEIVSILERQRQRLRGLRIDVDGQQQPHPPHAFTGIHMQFILSGERLDADKVNRALDLSVNKYCSVAATLRGVAAITYGFEIEE